MQGSCLMHLPNKSPPWTSKEHRPTSRCSSDSPHRPSVDRQPPNRRRPTAIPPPRTEGSVVTGEGRLLESFGAGQWSSKRVVYASARTKALGPQSPHGAFVAQGRVQRARPETCASTCGVGGRLGGGGVLRPKCLRICEIPVKRFSLHFPLKDFCWTCAGLSMPVGTSKCMYSFTFGGGNTRG